MTPSPELQELRKEYQEGCAWCDGHLDVSQECTEPIGNAVCTILTDGACPRSTAPDKWYHDRVVATAAREWWATDYDENPDAKDDASDAFTAVLMADSERRAQGGGNK